MTTEQINNLKAGDPVFFNSLSKLRGEVLSTSVDKVSIKFEGHRFLVPYEWHKDHVHFWMRCSVD
jgi:hypothetical protein